jgi:hypothetical protein
MLTSPTLRAARSVSAFKGKEMASLVDAANSSGVGDAAELVAKIATIIDTTAILELKYASMLRFTQTV